MLQVQDKNIAVLGALRHGLSAVRFLAMRGARVSLFGFASDEEQARIRKSLTGVSFHFFHGAIAPGILNPFDGIVVTPGGGRLFRERLAEAGRHGVKQITDLELALSQYRAPIIAITGSNGKSTVAHLLRHVMACAGKRVVTAGGDGLTYCDSLLESGRYDYVILEISSSRLARLSKIDPFVAVLTNLYPGHSERHGSFKEYAFAKAKIYRDQSPGHFLVHSGMSASIEHLFHELPPPAQTVPFSFQGKTQPGIALDPDKQSIWMDSPDGRREVIEFRPFPLTGTQNLENALAAAAVARLCGIDAAVIGKALRTTPALPDRMQWLGRFGGVEYINDARSSNAMAALSSLHAYPERSVIWISGGVMSPDAKNRFLVEMIQKKVKCMLLFGSKRRHFFKLWGAGVEAYTVPDLSEAVVIAAQHAQPGDTVLFSPGVRPELHDHGSTERRGRVFRSAVAGLEVKTKH